MEQGDWTMNKAVRLNWLLTLVLALGMSTARADEPILRGGDITEGNLIEALTPPAGPAGVDEGQSPVRTRSIKVMRDQPAAKPGAAAVQQASKKASASLLITFATNSTELTEEAKASLDVVARALLSDRLASFGFSIEGHADPRGNADDNMMLSQGRAESVVNYLVTAHNIERSRLQPIGKGSTELANTQRIDAPENRRVTITTVK
jgi:outer membrane protein OmpA-like peptidoglycan-associated protein